MDIIDYMLLTHCLWTINAYRNKLTHVFTVRPHLRILCLWYYYKTR